MYKEKQIMEPKYLLKIEIGENNNKFYKMIPNGSTFEVQYGRVGNNPQTDSYLLEHRLDTLDLQ